MAPVMSKLEQIQMLQQQQQVRSIINFSTHTDSMVNSMVHDLKSSSGNNNKSTGQNNHHNHHSSQNNGNHLNVGGGNAIKSSSSSNGGRGGGDRGDSSNAKRLSINQKSLAQSASWSSVTPNSNNYSQKMNSLWTTSTVVPSQTQSWGQNVNCGKVNGYASAQSSPPSQKSSSSSSSSSKNLWDTPQSKISIDSPTLSQSSKDSGSVSTIWFTPPQSQSPPTFFATSTPQKDKNCGSEVPLIGAWDKGLNSATISQKLSQQQQQIENMIPIQGRLVRPQDLNMLTSSPAPLKGGSIWSNEEQPKGAGGIIPSVGWSDVFENSVEFEPQTVSSVWMNNTASNEKDLVNPSSSCLQLFSDEFLNYLNMIN